MKAEVAYFHCGQQLRETLAKEIAEIESIIASIRWAETFRYETGEHQTAYNRAFGEAFGNYPRCRRETPGLLQSRTASATSAATTTPKLQ